MVHFAPLQWLHATRHRQVRRSVNGLLGVVVVLAWPGLVKAESLERELLQRAPAIIKKLQGIGYKNVGVLKFLVKKGDGPYTDNVGTLNLDVANRLTVALALANDTKAPLGIIRDASAAAARLPGANHLTMKGREKLFAGSYRLAWGKGESVPADAFLTGMVRIQDDLNRMAVDLEVVERGALRRLFEQPFYAAMSSGVLAEAGESFLLRTVKVAKSGEPAPGDDAAAIQQAKAVKDGQARFPLLQDTAPVALEIDYDDQRISLETKGGRGFVPEPRQGQKVTFKLKRQGPGRYGVVLKLNGLNTLEKQPFPANQCWKWILEPGADAVVIDGYQYANNTKEPFVVASPQASREHEMNYGADVGTIELVVFRESTGQDEAEVASDEDEDAALLGRGVLPRTIPATLGALRAQLRKARLETRGLIEAGARSVRSEVQRVSFRPHPTAVMTAVITYYQPQTK